MKSSGVLATLMLAAVASYASAQCDLSATISGATDAAPCANAVANDASCTQLMTDGTCTPSTCPSGTSTVGTPGVCTGNTYAYVAPAFPGCDTTEGTAAIETVREFQCEQTVPAVAGEAAGKCSGTAPATDADLKETCAAVPITCANGAGSTGSAFVCSNEATDTVQKAGATPCATDGSACNAAACCEAPAVGVCAGTLGDDTQCAAVSGYSTVKTSYALGFACGADPCTAAECCDTTPPCTAVDTPAGCAVPACTAVDTPYVGCTLDACTAADTPYVGCTAPTCTGVDTPWAACTVPTCTDTDVPYAGCTAVTCAKDESVTSKACVACATGKVNAAGDDKFGADTACTAKPAPVAAASGAATTVVSLTSLLALVFAA